jgi:hypothetical protein
VVCFVFKLVVSFALTSFLPFPPPIDRPIQSPLTTRKGMRRTYSKPDPHWGEKILKLFSDINTYKISFPYCGFTRPREPWPWILYT